MQLQKQHSLLYAFVGRPYVPVIRKVPFYKVGPGAQAGQSSVPDFDFVSSLHVCSNGVVMA